MGAFVYSPVAGAAANQLPDPVPEDVGQRRLERLMRLQADISRERLARWVGRDIDVLVDEAGPEGAIARSPMDAPEIDGNVHLHTGGLRSGDLVRVRVVASDDHDLEAEPLQERGGRNS